jgi:anti-sigma factor RsiW
MMNDENLDAHDEAFMLMSLALDGLLGPDELARLQQLVAADPALGGTWRRWQNMDVALAAMPHAEPAPGFVSRFDARLTRAERRARLRRGFLFALTAAFVWTALFVTVAAIGWLLVMSQVQWMNGFVRDLAIYPSAAATWFRALWTSLSATVGEPQTLILLVGYGCFTLALLGLWFRFLQRSTQGEVVS